MKPQSDTSLEAAIQAMKADQPEDSQVITAAQRLAGRLGIESPAAILSDTIRGCSDVQQMLPAYHAGAVAANRALVIEAHLKECSMCRSVNARGGAPALVDSAKGARLGTGTRRSDAGDGVVCVSGLLADSARSAGAGRVG